MLNSLNGLIEKAKPMLYAGLNNAVKTAYLHDKKVFARGYDSFALTSVGNDPAIALKRRSNSLKLSALPTPGHFSRGQNKQINKYMHDLVAII